MFSVWSREFNSRLAVTGKNFVITLPLNDLLNINAIKYTKIGNWIELSGTVEAPKVSSIINIDGNRTEPSEFNSSRHQCFSCRTSKREEKERTKAEAKARAKQLF